MVLKYYFPWKIGNFFLPPVSIPNHNIIVFLLQYWLIDLIDYHSTSRQHYFSYIDWFVLSLTSRNDEYKFTNSKSSTQNGGTVMAISMGWNLGFHRRKNKLDRVGEFFNLPATTTTNNILLLIRKCTVASAFTYNDRNILLERGTHLLLDTLPQPADTPLPNRFHSHLCQAFSVMYAWNIDIIYFVRRNFIEFLTLLFYAKGDNHKKKKNQ